MDKQKPHDIHTYGHIHKKYKECFVCGSPVPPGGRGSCTAQVGGMECTLYFHKSCYDEDVIKKKIAEMINEEQEQK